MIKFKAGYADRGRAACNGCQQDIAKDSLQLGIMTQTFPVNGKELKWYHPPCFFREKKVGSENMFDGLTKLRYQDRNEIRILAGCQTKSNASERKRSKIYFELRGELKAEVTEDTMKAILDFNMQAIPDEYSDLLDHTTDVIYYGSLVPCDKCKNGKFMLRNWNYMCDGNNCRNVVKEPKRIATIIHKKFKDQHTFLAKLFKVKVRQLETEISKKIHVPKVFKSKNIDVVDPDSQLSQNTHHIYCDGNLKYSVILTLVDIQTNTNSFHQIQLLESDNKENFWVFQSWGRISTTIDSSILDGFFTLAEAQTFFKTIFHNMTGNIFGSRRFARVPGKFFMLDIEEMTWTLDKSVTQLIEKLFAMNALPEACENDRPLGRISTKQIQAAINMLEHISQLIRNEKTLSDEFIEATNHFHMMFPFNYGQEIPQCFTDCYDVNNFMNSLKRILASSKKEDQLNKKYTKLDCDIQPINNESEEFQMLNQCFDITKHRERLNVEKIFRIKRRSEENRFKPYERFKNRQLLWHGSRLNNCVGILSEGLKIKPPGVHHNGSQFGNGIYFSDMAARSIPYSPEGIMMLCEVALGDAIDVNQPVVLPSNKHSIKALGKYQPDQKIPLENGLTIGSGNIVAHYQYVISYNEYIVHNPAQVKIRYLFQYKS